MSDEKIKELKSLIIVPGHAVYIGTDAVYTEIDEHWLGRFGYYGEGRLYTEHTCAGVFLANRDEEAMLIFSGGQTREEAGPISEAQGYWQVANQRGWLNHPEVKERTFLEEFARDSFENLEFSVLRFEQITRRRPRKVMVCGFGFKADRYKFHAETVGIPDFDYVTVNEPPHYVLHQGGSLAGEKDTIELFLRDPRGEEEELMKKKVQRDPFNRGNPYRT